MIINLISVDNGVGLTQDMAIVKDILKGHRCTFHDVRAKYPPKKADINIFFEIINSKFYHKARINLFFPNPEWFWFNSQLKGIDLVLCKTIDAQRIFNNFGCRTLYTSFTSRDMKAETLNYRSYLHLAGQSTNKGTKEVIEAWGENMPPLTLCSTKKQWPETDNVTPIFSRMEENELTFLMNSTTFHLCPSDYEGFGHYLWEAKSCGAIVITTDAEPMNHFVTDGVDGFLVPVERTSKQQAVVLKHISPEGLRVVVKRTEGLTEDQIVRMCTASRKAWEYNDKFFKRIFTVLINSFENTIHTGTAT
jgi:glycosyltransferase involved in cell wall biosynthesis